MKVLASFTTPEEANLLRAYLGNLGIDAFLEHEYFVQLFWIYSNAVGGVRVLVSDDDFDDAAEAYHGYMDAIRTSPSPLEPVRAWPFVVLMTLCLGVPFILFGRRPAKADEPEWH